MDPTTESLQNPVKPENGNTSTVQVSSLLSDPLPEEPPAKKVKTEELIENSSTIASSEPAQTAPAAPAAQPAPLTQSAPHVKQQSVPNHKEPPVHEMVGGSSVRQYLNQNLTAHLLEGLKLMAKQKPEDPLRELGEFLIERSKDLKKADA